ncbi:MAG: VPLPA-CTERM sorting domain-containing protein [Gammaproteobacteria bacterium]
MQVQAANSDAASRDGSGDLLLVARNAANTQTLLWDLSGAGSDLTAADLYNQNLPANSFPMFSLTVNDWVADQIGDGDIYYNILGLSEVFGVCDGFLCTAPANPDLGGTVSATSGSGQPNGAQVANTLNAYQQYFAAVNSAGLTDNGALVIDDPGSSAFFGNTFHDANLFGFSSTSTVNGGLLPFLYIQQDPNVTNAEQPAAAPLITPLGNFEFTFDAGVATLQYTAVPLPAGVWLLGSALVGLVGVRRRA